MTLPKKVPAARKVQLSPAFVKKVRRHIKTIGTMEDAAAAMGFDRWQTLSELLNRKTCRKSSLDKINKALEATNTPETEQKTA